MKAAVVFLCTILLYLHLPAQNVESLTREANRLEALPNEKAAFDQFKAVLKLDPINVYALSKCSELCSRIGKRQADKKAMDDYYEAARTYAGIALRVSPDNSGANCSMAMALGRSSLSKGGKEKIETAKEIKKHIDIAIKSDPNNYIAWHILGRWNYEICSLNGLEKTAVKLLYGGLPAASLKESVKAFEQSKAIANGFVLNYFELAKAYKKDDQKNKAIACLKAMLILPNHTEDDSGIKEDGKKLLKDWE